jgi:hypothetical protein
VSVGALLFNRPAQGLSDQVTAQRSVLVEEVCHLRRLGHRQVATAQATFAPRFLVAAGGTLAQLGLPLGFAVYFFWKRREPFSACVALLWLFASMQNMGIYMKDARFLLLPLFGADPLDGHDWNYLFGQMRLLHRSVEIGGFFQGLGRLGMAGVLAGMLGLVVRGRPQPPPGA